MVFTLPGIVAICAVIFPALALAVIIRRWVVVVPWNIVLACLGLSLVALGPSLFKATLPVPVDEVARGYPYRGVTGEPVVGNALTNDTSRQMLPWMQSVREGFARLDAPLWNPYSFAGYPLLGNGQSAPFSPFFLVTIVVDLPYQIVAMAGLKIFVSLLFGVLLLRSRGASAGTALAGSAIFALSIFQTVYLYYPITAVTSLLPALLFFIHRTMYTEVRQADPVGLALVTASILAGGHPESAFHCAFAAALFVAFGATANRPVSPSWWKNTSRAVAAPVALGVLIAAPAWLPFLEQVVNSDRMVAVSTDSMTPTRPLVEWQLLGHPDRFGNPARGDWHGPANYCVVAPTYISLILVTLAIAALLGRYRSRNSRLLIASGLAMFFVALGWQPLAWVNNIPPFAWAANDRLRFAGLLFIILGAAPILDRPRRQSAAVLALGAVAAVTLWWFAWGHRGHESLDAGDVIAPAGVVALAILGLLIRDRHRRVFGVVVAALVSFELLVLTRGFNAACDITYFRPLLPIVEALHDHAAGEGSFRVVGHDWVLLPNGSAHYQLEDIRGSDPMAWRPYLDFLELTANPKHLYGILRVTRLPNPALDFLGVRYVMAAPGARQPKTYETIYSSVDGQLWHNPVAMPRFFVPRELRGVASRSEALEHCREISDFRQLAVLQDWAPPAHFDPASVEIVEVQRRAVAEYALDVVAEAPGVIVSSLPAVPGWRASVDGRARAIQEANGAFLAIQVEPGDHSIHIRYQPRAFTVAILLCTLGLILLAIRQAVADG